MSLLCVVFEKSASEVRENSGCECLGDPLNYLQLAVITDSEHKHEMKAILISVHVCARPAQYT